MYHSHHHAGSFPAHGFNHLPTWNPHPQRDHLYTRNALFPSVPIGEHTLPPLPYDYDALEPYIDEMTMRLHHDSHHPSYVEGLNQAEQMMAQARRTGDYKLIKHWEREAAFHGAGHYLHTIFWNVMSPQGGGEPAGELAVQIKKDFGSFSRFTQHFSSAAEKVEGVGWAILVWSPRSRRLEILQAEKHQNLSQWDVIPLLVLDIWEHAYYLKYKNNRRAYIDAWWNVVHWKHVSERFDQARALTWQPY
jgi:Fe-Mn family superoxide dismutase